MRVRVSLNRILILTAMVTFPIIAHGQWEYETVTVGGQKCEIAVDSIGNPHISYIDNIGPDTGANFLGIPLSQAEDVRRAASRAPAERWAVTWSQTEPKRLGASSSAPAHSPPWPSSKTTRRA